MCRNIKLLFNFEPPADETEVRAAALQFVRKVSGSVKPSKANEEAFEQAVTDVSGCIETLLNNLVTTATPKDREVEADKRRQRTVQRYSVS